MIAIGGDGEAVATREPGQMKMMKAELRSWKQGWAK